MKSHISKIIILIVLVIIAAGIIVATGHKIGSQAQPTQDESAMATSTDTTATTNWLTYANSKFGFSIQYPNTWTMQNTSSGVVFYSDEGAPLMTINNPIREAGHETLVQTNTEKMVIDGQTLTKTSFVDQKGGASGNPSVQVSWNENSATSSGEIWFYLKGTFTNDSVNQILSTFKFTDAASSTQVTSVSTKPTIISVSPSNRVEAGVNLVVKGTNLGHCDFNAANDCNVVVHIGDKYTGYNLPPGSDQTSFSFQLPAIPPGVYDLYLEYPATGQKSNIISLTVIM